MIPPTMLATHILWCPFVRTEKKNSELRVKF